MRFFVITLLFISQISWAAVQEIDGIAAIVDEEIITRQELKQRLNQTMDQLKQARTQLPAQHIIERQVLERLIIETIQLERANMRGIRITEEKLNDLVAGIAQQNQLSLFDFRRALEAQGVSYNQFRKQIENEFIINRLKQKEVDEAINVTQKEVDDFLKKSIGGDNDTEYQLSHILIAIPEAATPEVVDKAKEKVMTLYNEIKAGKDFKQMAIAYSDGQQALQGGDLGWRKKDYLPTLFLDVVTTMKTGDVSQPVRSSSGFHLLKLEGKRGQKQQISRQVNARHILLQTGTTNTDKNARKQLEIVRQQIVDGEDFAKLAKAFSEDPGSAENGGELGWNDPTIYVEAFQKKLNELNEGELSQPFKSDFGWHIVQLLGWREQAETDAIKRSKAMQALRQQKIEEARQNWIRRIRDEAYVEIR